MKSGLTSRGFRAVAIVLAGAMLASCGQESGPSTDGALDEVVITAYGTGTTGYSEVAAVAEAVTSAEGTRFRVLPSDTGVGRIQPLSQGAANFMRGGEEYVYAFEGDYEFAAAEWGPQPVQMVWTPVNLLGFLVKSDSGIESPADLAGKRVPQITANTSAEVKVDGLLAAGGLDMDDVEPVPVSYGDQPDALKNGAIDMMVMGANGANISELKAAIDIEFLTIDPDDQQVIDGFQDISPAYTVDEFTGLPTQEEGATDTGLYYPLSVVTYSDTPSEHAYEMTRMIVENYDAYAETTNSMYLWSQEEVPLVPTVVPFHEGTVTYLEEAGLWTEEAAEKNDELLQRGEDLQEQWQAYIDQAGDDINPDDWSAWKEEHLKDS